MAGSIMLNLLTAVFGFIFVFTISWTTNTWQTSIIRGATYFFIFFVITFPFRGIWSLVKNNSMTVQDSKLNKQSNNPKQFDDQEDKTHENVSKEVSAKETSEMIRSLLNEK